MANSLSVAGNTRLQWSLSDGTAGVGKQMLAARTITNGTGPNQATVAYYEQVTATGSGFTRSLGALPVTVLGIAGSAGITNVREILVSVPSGPTGGALSLAGPAGITGVRLGVGGQFHWVDYATGATGTSTSVTLSSGVTGTYTVDVTLVGVGSYVD